MDKIINLGIPHVGEQILESLNYETLTQCLKVSKTWKIMAKKILLLRLKGKMPHAWYARETEIVKLLLENFSSEESGMNVKNKYGYTPFMVACDNGRKDVVKLFLKYSEIDFNVRDNDGNTAFVQACQRGRKDVVKLILKHARAKGIEIPTFTSTSSNITTCFPNEIRDLIKVHSPSGCFYWHSKK